VEREIRRLTSLVDGTSFHTLSEERSVLDALYSLGNDWVIVWTWDNNQWYAKPHPLSGIDLSYPKIDKFKKGKAYWILMKPGNEAREWIQ